MSVVVGVNDMCGDSVHGSVVGRRDQYGKVGGTEVAREVIME